MIPKAFSSSSSFPQTFFLFFGPLEKGEEREQIEYAECQHLSGGKEGGRLFRNKRRGESIAQ